VSTFDTKFRSGVMMEPLVYLLVFFVDVVLVVIIDDMLVKSGCGSWLGVCLDCMDREDVLTTLEYYSVQ